MFKKICFMVLAGIFCLGFPVAVFADETVSSESSIAGTSLEAQTAERAFCDIKDQIIDDYSGLYKLDGFSYDYTLRDGMDKKYLDINVYVDMTLTRHPSESPYVLGMEKALREVEDTAVKEALQAEIDAYVAEIETLCFNIPDRSTFTYAVELDSTAAANALRADKNYKLFYRTDTDDEVLLTDADCLAEVEDFNESYQAGCQALKSMESNARVAAVDIDSAIAPRASFTYDRIAARDWARKNWDAAPEYPSAEVSGTDCANFVSKALNEGGIKEDEPGNWYRAKTWGGWPGDHWFRTGKDGRTGVVIYMTSKGYFYKETNENVISAGCIMYWNSKSHVALVTYGDGSTIKYTQHGASQTKDTVYRSENVSFYKASKSIC